MHRDGHQIIVSIYPQSDPGVFSIISKSPSAMQNITKEGGVWEWEIKAKKAGECNKLYFRVEVQNRYPIANCLIEKDITIEDLPVLLRAWNGLFNNWVAVFGWLIAIGLGILNFIQLKIKK